MSMKKNTGTVLIDPDVIAPCEDFNLPVVFPKIGVSPFTVYDFLRNGTEAINGHSDRIGIFSDGVCFDTITKFGLHCGDSVVDSLVFVKG